MNRRFFLFGLPSLFVMTQIKARAVPLAIPLIYMGVRIAAPHVARAAARWTIKACTKGRTCNNIARKVADQLRRRGIRNPQKLAEQALTETAAITIASGIYIVFEEEKVVDVEIQVENNSDKAIPFSPSFMDLVAVIEVKKGLFGQSREIVEVVERTEPWGGFSMLPGGKGIFSKSIRNSDFAGKKKVRLRHKEGTFESEPFCVGPRDSFPSDIVVSNG